MNLTESSLLPRAGVRPALITRHDRRPRQPAHECAEHPEGVRITVYVPGVDDSAVEIEGRGADLTVLARKERVVRPNFEALHLEAAQRDYLLRLRLGAGYDFSRMEAELAEGVLTVLVPRRSRTAAHGLAA